MPANFNNFTTGTSISDSDKIVGFTSATAGGERQWSFSSLKSAVLAAVSTGSPIQVRVAASINRSTGAQFSPGMWYNVRSVTDSTVQHKTINFSTPLPNANYVAIVNPIGSTVKSTTALGYEVRLWDKQADRISVFHQNELYLDREPSFDLIVLQ